MKCLRVIPLSLLLCVWTDSRVHLRAETAPSPPVSRKLPTLVKTDTDVDAALTEAKQAITQNHPADALKLYQRLLEQHSEVLYTANPLVDPNLYVSVANEVREVMRGLPLGMVELYRQTYEPLARAQYDEARQRFDASALRGVALRWPLTEIAPRAMLLAGAIYFDRGDFQRAAECDEQWRNFYLSENPEDEVQGQVQMFLAQLTARRFKEAEQTRASWQGNRRATVGGEEVVMEEFFKKQLETASAVRPPLISKEIDTEPVLDPQWIQEVGAVVPLTTVGNGGGRNFIVVNGRVVPNPSLNSDGTPYGLMPVITSGNRGKGGEATLLADVRVLVRTTEKIGCVDLIGGRLLWQSNAPLGYTGAGVGQDEEGNPIALSGGPGSVTVAEGRVYTLENFNGLGVGWGRMPQPAPDKNAQSSTLAARDLESGKLIWQVGRGQGENEFIKAARFVSLPTVEGGRLYVVAVHSQGFYLLCLSSLDGRLFWKTFLGQQPAPSPQWGYGRNGSQEEVSPPLLAANRIFCGTDAGVMVCADPDSGRIHWARQYATGSDPKADALARAQGLYQPPVGYPLNSPVASGEAIFFLPGDSEELMAVEAATGKLLWQKKRGGLKYLAGMAPGRAGEPLRLILTTPGAEAWSAEEGSVRWKAARKDFLARPALSGSHLYLSAAREGIVRLTLTDGAVEKIFPALSDEPILGNLVMAGGVMIAANNRQVAAYFDYSTSYQLASHRIREYPNTAEFYRLRGMISLKARQIPAALSDLEHGWGLLSSETPEATRTEWSALLFRAHLAEGLGASEKLKLTLQAAAPYAVLAAHRAELAIRWARYHEQKGNAPGAVEVLQSLLVDTPETMVAMPDFRAEELGAGAKDFRKSEILSSYFTQQEIARLMESHGRGLYAKFEQAARALEVDAVARKDVMGLLQVMGRYPNSEAAEQARMDLARLKYDEKDYQGAVEILMELTGRRPTVIHGAEALGAMTMSREKMEQPELAFVSLGRLAGMLTTREGGKEVGGAQLLFGGYEGNLRQFVQTRAAALGVGTSLVGMPSAHRDLLLPLGSLSAGIQGRLLLDRPGGEPLIWRNCIFTVESGKLTCRELSAIGDTRELWRADGEFGMLTRMTVGQPEIGARAKWGAMIIGSMLIVVDGSEIFGIELSGGRRLWAQKCGERFARMTSLAPVREGDVDPVGVVFSPQPETLVALALRTGEKLWEATLPGVVTAAQAPMQLWTSGRYLVVGKLTPGRFTVVERATGKITADLNLKTNVLQAEVLPSGILVVASPLGMSAYEIASGTLLWEGTVLGMGPRILATDGQSVYAVSDARPQDLAAVSAKTGKLLWRKKLSAGGKTLVPIFVQSTEGGEPLWVWGGEPGMNQQVILAWGPGQQPLLWSQEENRTKTLQLLALQPGSGEIAWRHDPPVPRWSGAEALRIQQSLFLVTQIRGQGTAQVQPRPTLPVWWTDSQMMILDPLGNGRQQLTVRDRFSGKLLQQWEREAPEKEAEAASQAPSALGGVGLGRIAIAPGGPGGGNGVGVTRGVLVGTALVLQQGEEVVVLQKEGANAKTVTRPELSKPKKKK